MARLDPYGKLRGRLADMPVECAQVIAARAAVRVLPLAVAATSRIDAGNLLLAVLRATTISWAACNYPTHDMSNAAARAAADAAASADNHASLVAAFAAGAARVTADAVDHTARTASETANAVRATYSKDKDKWEKDTWEAIGRDANWLEEHTDPRDAARVLTGRSLWLGQAPAWWLSLCNEGVNGLLEIDPMFAVWVEWYERRIRGNSSAFDIPHDKGRKEDKAILRRLADASDHEFWDRGAEFVNGELSRWLEEACERAAKNRERRQQNTRELIDQLSDEQSDREIPAQNPNALRFGSDEEGKIVLAPSFGNQELRNDDDARDRHQLALDDAKALMQACAGSNSADRLTAILTAYIAAAGDSVETMRPSVFVQKGERLRQESARYEDPDNFLPPLPDGIELDLKSLVKAHNMVVGLDPHLLEIDTAQTGPDDVIGDVTKQEMQGFANEAREEAILREDAADDLVEAVDLTPDGADASDRRFRWSASSCKNLVIEAFAVALNHPVKTTAVVAGSYAIGPIPLVGNALACAIFLVSRRKWIEEKLGRHAPTWKALFSDLCDKWDDMLDKPDE